MGCVLLPAISMSYAKKTCPYCGKIHKQRGPFCSKTCSNKNRRHSATTKAKIANSQRIHMTSYEGREQSWAYRARGDIELEIIHKKLDRTQVETNPFDLFMEPVVKEIGDNQFLADGDLWTEV